MKKYISFFSNKTIFRKSIILIFVFTVLCNFIVGQQQIITDDDPASGDFLGADIETYGDYAVIGAWGKDLDGFANTGVVFIYKYENGTWQKQATLSPSDVGEAFNFGRSVDIYEDYMVVGASGSLEQGVRTGSAYVFQRNGNTWIEVQRLVASDGNDRDDFGWSIAIHGDDIIVGARGDDDEFENAGAGYLFEKTTSGWVQTQKITASDNREWLLLGQDVDIENGRAIIGGTLNFSNEDGAYIFDKIGGVWEEQTKLSVPTFGQGDSAFGWQVLIQGDEAIVANWYESVDDNNRGAVYVFEKQGNDWTQTQCLRGNDLGFSSDFGSDIDIQGEQLIIGASRSGINSFFGNEGAAFLFQKIDGQWHQQNKFISDAPLSYNKFGSAVALSNESILIGEDWRKVGDAGSAGVVHVYDLLEETSMNKVKGKIFNDENGNCVYDVGEPVFNNWKINAVGQDSSSAFSLESGDYVLFVDESTYEIQFEAYPAFPFWKSCEDSYSVQISGAGQELVLNIPLQLSADCSNLNNGIANFTNLGEFNGHQYFLSKENMQPVDAQAFAVQNDGYLVTINDQAENDFIQQHISEFTFIGLNDEATEGEFAWIDQESFSYSNFGTCSFCSENEDGLDYVMMAPWDGKWSFSSLNNSRKYIVEIPCVSSTPISNITINCPSDLEFTTDANMGLTTINFSDATGTTDCPSGGLSVLNIGNLTSGSSVGIGVYTIPFEATDACGNISNCSFEITVLDGNTGGGECEDDIDGFTTIGEYGNSKYYISNGFQRADVAADHATQLGGYLAVINNQLENNFIQQNISEMAYIGLNDVQTEGNLEWVNGDAVNYNNINPCSFCSNNTPFLDHVMIAPWDGSWSFSSKFNQRKYIVEIPCDAPSGNIDISYECPTEFPQPGIWEIPITLVNTTSSPTTAFDLQIDLLQFGSGPIFTNPLGEVQVPSLQVGASATVLLECSLPGTVSYLPNRVNNIPNPNGRIIYTDYIVRADVSIPLSDPEMTIDFYCKKYSTDLQVAIEDAVPNITSDNEVIYSVAVTNNGNETAYNIQTKLLQTIGSYPPVGSPTWNYSVDILNMNQGSWERQAEGNYIWMIPELGVGETVMVDVVYHLDDPLEYNNDIPNSVTIDVEVESGHLLDTDPSNNFNSYTFIKEGGNDCPNDISGFTLLGEFNNSKYFISNNISRPIDAQAVALQNNGNLAVINSQEENDFLQQHIDGMTYIGLDDAQNEGTPQWINGDATSFTNFDICSFCKENSSNYDYVMMHGWNGGWSWSNIWNQRKYIVEIPCAEPIQSPNVSNTLIALPIFDKDRLTLDKLMPNPANDFIHASIFSVSENEIEVQVIDARGVLVKTEIVSIHQGSNTIEISIADLPSGFYMVYVPDARSKQAMQRFVKMSD